MPGLEGEADGHGPGGIASERGVVVRPPSDASVGPFEGITPIAGGAYPWGGGVALTAGIPPGSGVGDRCGPPGGTVGGGRTPDGLGPGAAPA